MSISTLCAVPFDRHRWQHLARRYGMKSVVGVLVLLAACKAPNPDTCCVDRADCDAFGLPDIQPCPAGLTCVGHLCVEPQCSTAGCPASAPICDTASDICTGCTDSSDCSRFPATDVCDPTTGACVACVTATDCATAAPICESGACRGCKLDSECASGACGDDGACVPEAGVVYLSPTGTDTGACTRAAPCKNLTYAAGQTSVGRRHVVMASGSYSDFDAYLTPQTVAAQPLVVHGNDAMIIDDGGEVFVFQVFVRATLRDLRVSTVTGSGFAIADQPVVLERTRVSGGRYGVSAGRQTTLKSIIIEDTGTGIVLGPGGHLTIDGGVIRRGDIGIQVTDRTATFDIANVLIANTSDVAFDAASGGTGMLRFSTIAHVGGDAGNGPRAVRCPTILKTVDVVSTIIWAPGIVNRPPIDSMCSLTTTIAGPTPVAGADASDPRFANAAAGDFHLSPASPARDLVDTGPATDFEGDLRPRGARFDIGADETP